LLLFRVFPFLPPTAFPPPLSRFPAFPLSRFPLSRFPAFPLSRFPAFRFPAYRLPLSRFPVHDSRTQHGLLHRVRDVATELHVASVASRRVYPVR
jgi:hypothetical protein